MSPPCTHWNSQLGSGVKETTDYDAQGRIIKIVDLGGDTTSYTYYNLSYQGTFTGIGKTTTNAAGRTENEYFDIYGRETSKTDFGGNTYNDSYDNAGRKILETNSLGENVSTTYFNTGLTNTIVSGNMNNTTHSGINYITAYGYDQSGNEISENYASSYWTGYSVPGGGAYWLPTSYIYRKATATWDANNRMLTFHDDGNAGTNPASITWEYDLAGNVRHTAASYRDVNSGNTLAQDYWYKYDSMNRFTTTKGILWGVNASGTVVTGDAARGIGSISRGYTGRDIVYNAASQRVAELQTVQGNLNLGIGGSIPDYFEQREIYGYTEDGYLASVSMSAGAYSLSAPTPTSPPAAAPVTGASQAQYTRDAMGRVTLYSEGNSYSRQDTYNAKSQITSETVSTLQYDGTTLIATTAYDYVLSTTGSTWNGTSHGTYNGAYQGGIVTHTLTANSRLNTNGTTTILASSETESKYAWWDDARITHKGSWPNVGSTVYTSDYTRDATGQLIQLLRNESSSGQVSYTVDAQNHVTSRMETAVGWSTTAIDYSYFFGGVLLGRTGNNGPDADDYALAVGQFQAQQTRAGPFQNAGPNAYANFDQSYDPINPASQAQTAGTYTVVDGDTLGSIAQTVWGDSSLWYLIADANGLRGPETLRAGQDLTIPSKVTNIHNTSSTYRVYDPNQAQGPTEPIPPAIPPSKHHGCGILGQILMVVVAVAVTIVTTGAAVALAAGNGTTLSAGMGAVLGTSAGAGVSLGTGAAIAAGTAGAAAGSIVSQGIGVATGLQDHFSWGAVGLSALTAFLGPVPVGRIGESAFLGNIAGGALTNLAVQGIATAAGLQDRFDWSGVAVAGIASGTGQSVADTGLAKSLGTFGGVLVSGMAGAIAGATARSLITGTDFGDNIVRVLPNVIGNTVGNLIGDEIARIGSPKLNYGHAGPDVGGATDAGDAPPDWPMPGLANSTQIGHSSGAQAQFGDIVVIADQRMHSLYRMMDSYQWSAYFGQVGQRNDETTAYWALNLRTPIFDDPYGQWRGFGIAWTGSSSLNGPLPSGIYHNGFLKTTPYQAPANIYDRPIGDGGPVINFAIDSLLTLGLAAGPRLAGAAIDRGLASLGPRELANHAPLSVEARFQANSLRLADEGHSTFMRGVANGDIILNPKLSMEIQRGSFVDGFIRRGNLTLRNELGLDTTTVRINQRLYVPEGKYTVPDLHFPGSGNSIDYSYQFKNATIPQIIRIQKAAPNGTITIVSPSVIRPVYTIRP